MKKFTMVIVPLFALTLIYSACNKVDKDDTNTVTEIKGCMDANALNYDPTATEDDGSCTYYKSDQDTSGSSGSGTTNMIQEDVVIYNMANAEGNNEVGKTGGLGDSIKAPACAIISVDDLTPGSYPKTLTIDFGTTNCLCYDGRYRRGKLIARFSNSWINKQVGDSLTVSLVNYYVNDTMVTGTRYFVIEEKASLQGTLQLKTGAENCAIVYAVGDSLTWSSTGTYKYSGLLTYLDYSDDELSIDVTGTGKNRQDKQFTYSTTNDPVIAKGSCIDYCGFVDGTIDISLSESQDTTLFGVTVTVVTDVGVAIDYGDGACDDKLNVTTKVKVSTGSTILADETYGPDEYACGEY